MEETKYEYGRIINGDCLEIMDKLIEEGIRVDCVITDLPYGTTTCKWDEIIPFEPMWDKLKIITKSKNTPIVFFGAMPFTAKLVNSNIKGYKHHWIWEKNRGTGFQVAKYRPMMTHEDIITFTVSGDRINYYPQMIKRDTPVKYKYSSKTNHNFGTDKTKKTETYTSDTKYPINVIKYNKVSKPIHSTQKPTELLEYLIKTYTNEGELVLDITAGSMSLAQACINTNRNFICIEKDEQYYEIGVNRINGFIKETSEQYKLSEKYEDIAR